jgi:uncharacterized protein YbbC (DUF1343 family)
MARVLSGLEVFLEGGAPAAALPKRARVGLVAHPASVDSSLRHAVERLLARDELRLVRLFAPEHGVRGEAQDMEAVEEAVDPASGLPVVSLYGEDPASLRPKPEHLADLDAILYDLQDAGCRTYTYATTLSFVMEEAARAGLPVVVLDRPNPIGGIEVEGPVLDPKLASFVGRFPLPVRHGMTMGELARLFQDELRCGCDLRVVPMAGWRRSMHFGDTGLPWVAPSPNLPTPGTALVYPGGCLVEGTNLSEGRGTTRPFELVGAPWLAGPALARALDGSLLEGVRFREAWFRPMFHKYAGRLCSGVQVHVVDRRSFRPFRTYLALLREARLLAPEEFDWRREPYEFETSRLAVDLLLGREDLRPMIEAGAPVAEIEASWQGPLREFLERREPYLLYSD